MKFAERLRQERIANGYNQVYIAKYMNVSQVSVTPAHGHRERQDKIRREGTSVPSPRELIPTIQEIS